MRRNMLLFGKILFKTAIIFFATLDISASYSFLEIYLYHPNLYDFAFKYQITWVWRDHTTFLCFLFMSATLSIGIIIVALMAKKWYSYIIVLLWTIAMWLYPIPSVLGEWFCKDSDCYCLGLPCDEENGLVE